jgi:hypothetical protein
MSELDNLKNIHTVHYIQQVYEKMFHCKVWKLFNDIDNFVDTRHENKYLMFESSTMYYLKSKTRVNRVHRRMNNFEEANTLVSSLLKPTKGGFIKDEYCS